MVGDYWTIGIITKGRRRLGGANFGSQGISYGSRSEAMAVEFNGFQMRWNVELYG